MITRSRQTATRTLMPSLAECLGYARSADACLARAGWIHLNNHTRSLFRFLREFSYETCPSCVTNALGKVVISHHVRDVQFLNSNQSEVDYNRPTKFVVKVGALIPNVNMGALKQLNRFAATVPAPLSSRHLALGYSQLTLACRVIARILNSAAIGECSEGRNTNIDPRHQFGCGQWFKIAFNREQSEPPTRFALDGQGFNLPLKLAMQFNSHVSNSRQPQFFPSQCLPDLPKCDGVVSTCRAKTWVARFLSSLDPSKEGFEREVYALQNIFKYVTVDLCHVFSNGFDLDQLNRLIEVRNRFALSLPRLLSFLKARVVSLTTDRKMIIQHLLLPFGWINPITKGLNHNVYFTA